MRGILVFGDISVDLLGCLPSDPAFGADNLAPELTSHCGGVGTNVAVALARWGVPARLLGCVGRDAFGEFAVRFLQANRVDVSFVQRRNGITTGLFFIAVSPSGQRTIFGSRGANAAVTPPDAKWSCLDGVAGVHLVGYNFLSRSAAEVAGRVREEAATRGAWVALDVGMAPSQQIPEKITEAARKVDILFVGLNEALALSGQQDRKAALAALHIGGPREILVKLGEEGCLILEDAEWQHVPALPVVSCDTTGAGDAFAAAYLQARLRNWSARNAALLANAAGALAATRVGTGEAMPHPGDILRLLAGARLAAPWEHIREEISQRLSEEIGAANVAGSGGHDGTAA